MKYDKIQNRSQKNSHSSVPLNRLVNKETLSQRNHDDILYSQLISTKTATILDLQYAIIIARYLPHISF